jgi:hypothetical protein
MTKPIKIPVRREGRKMLVGADGELILSTPDVTTAELDQIVAALNRSATPTLADAVAHIERKAEDYANRFGWGIAGSLSFDSQVKTDHYVSLMELADELRELAASPADHSGDSANTGAPKVDLSEKALREMKARIDNADCTDLAFRLEVLKLLRLGIDEALSRQGVTLSDALKDTAAHLAAAISLLERSPKKGAPSNKIFDLMLSDYRASLDRARAALSRASSSRAEVERDAALPKYVGEETVEEYILAGIADALRTNKKEP